MRLSWTVLLLALSDGEPGAGPGNSDGLAVHWSAGGVRDGRAPSDLQFIYV